MKTRSITRNPELVLLLVLSLPLLFYPPPSSAQEFKATTIGDFGHVTVMEVTGNYDAKNPDGSVNSFARQAVANEFFRFHKDAYDFLVIFSNFDFQMPDPEAKAIYHPIKNDVRGIGIPLFDHSSLFGSNGKLQGIIDMGNISNLVVDPLDPRFEETLTILSHEQMHRWGAYVKFRKGDGSMSTSLLGRDGKHWSYLLDSSASVLYGHKWQSNGDGTFTSIDARKYYSPLDFYLMGFYDSSQVPPMLLIESPAIDSSGLPQVGVTISGTPRYIEIRDIIDAEGPRIPDSSESQKTFKAAFILITLPNTFRGDEVYGLENIRKGWTSLFSILTDGQGLLHVASLPAEDIPANPGIPKPPVTPRTAPPDIEDAIRWLINQQRSDGSWMDLLETAERDTAEAVFALKHFAIARESYSMGLQWLHVISSGNTDYLSRKIEVLAQSGQNSTALIRELLSNQNADGGWGRNKHYMSNAIDTSFALKALAANGQVNPTVISKAIGYLKSKQNADGGWGNEDGESSIEATVNALRAFHQYKLSYPLDDSIERGIAWLCQRQNPDGGFGNSPSTVYDTALAVLSLNELDLSREAISLALNYILSVQSADGSWNGSAYQTALSVGAVWKATIDPDLSIKNDDITFNPSMVTILPSEVSINAVIRNLGKTDVPKAKVVLYDGAISEAHKVSEQTLSFPGQTSVSATFSVMITDGREHRFYFVVDPENHVKESNEANNKAVKILYPGATYDFVMAQVSATPNPADIFEDVIITSTITNRGTMDAYNVQVRYYIDDPAGSFDISTVTVVIPANSTVTRTITWRAVRAGDHLPITVHVDPFNLFDELSEVNNRGTTSLTVRSSTEPNLKVSYQDIIITPTPARERGEANLSIPVKNDGFSSASNVEVRFYKGIPGVDGVLLGSRTIPLLNAGETKRVSMDWQDIRNSGERIIYIQVDPDNVIKEVREDDNTAFTSLKILSLPDFMVTTNSISFLPPAPKDGDTVSIRVMVQNRGEQDASNILVRAYEKGAVIGSQTISSIGGLSQSIVSFSYDTTNKSGPHQIEVVVDPEGAILEQSKDNNRASRTFGVQDGNLWLTEPYISPNGDGVKDSTGFFFRLETPRTVKVVVVNKDGKSVRAFSGGEFENTTAGNVTWDGLDDDGRVVSDGQYRMELRDEEGNTMGSLLVVVDNNRSPFTDAIGTKYLVNQNLTCMLPYTYFDWYTPWSDRLEWFSDESGFLLGIQYPNDNTPEYPTGLYKVSSDGKDGMRIIPWQWSKNVGYNDDEFRVEHFKLSPDTEQVAFILWKYEGPVPWGHFDVQLWTANREGGNLRLLDSWKQGGYPNDEMRWSPDGQNIAYKRNYELWMVKLEGTGITKIDLSPTSGWAGDFKWSPDGKSIAYIIQENWNADVRIMLSDTFGNKKEVVTPFSIDIFDSRLEWLGNEKMVVINIWHWMYPYYEIGITEAFENGLRTRITHEAFSREYRISPDQNYIAFIEPDEVNWAVKVSDQAGRVTVLHESQSVAQAAWWFRNLANLSWFQDSRQLAFVDYTYGKIDDCHFEGYLIIVDIKENKKRAFKVTQYNEWQSVCEEEDGGLPIYYFVSKLQWFPDHLSLIGQEGRFGEIFVTNSETEEKVALPIYGVLDGLSPLGRYITFNRGVDPTSACFGKAGGQRGEYDLWAMSSLLNLTANLRVVKDRSVIVLKGIAADLNFEGYQLEYADIRSPHLWNPITPPSEVPVINDVFTTWVPPYEGTFYVKLTVRDKAGNVAWDRKRVSWGLSSSITNLYKSLDHFSPNGDGVKDMVNLHYTVVEPVHLVFYVFDENNHLKRTFLKDHPMPTNDFVTWDGRDEAGRVVADGKYKIKVFHYEFIVEVDNTPPGADIALTQIRQGSEAKVDLVGHVFDEKLKHWIIEYGEGENPRQWFIYEKGEDLLVKKDSDGNPKRPIQDVVIETYREDDLEWLVGKKLRITAEDFAGNRRTVVTDFLEEVFVLNRWDNRVVTEIIPADLARSGVHSIGGFETIRLPLLEIRLQYWTGGRWLDGPGLTEPTSGSFRVEWDNSGLNPMEGFAVRMKAIDLLGKELYSNVLSTKQLFEMRGSCDPMMPVRAENSLYEDLSTIRFQVRSDYDSRYYNWTEYEIWDRSKGDTIPVGGFIPPLPSIQSGMKYTLRMVGIGVSGKVYESGSAQYPPHCPIKITLKVDYPQAECGATSNRALLSSKAEGLSNRRVPQSLSYYIEKSGEPILLKQFDLTGEPWSGVLVDTRQINEGSYPIHVLLSYLDLDENAIKEASASETLLVDRLLPTGQITYPAKTLRVCPSTVSDPKGNWFGIGVEGVAGDNGGVKGYELFYGIGEDPAQWLPATSQSGGKSFSIAGAGAVKGKIGVWDVTYLTGTSYSLMLKVVDLAGNTGCFTTHFSIDQVVNIPVLTTDKLLFSPNGDEIFDRVQLHYEINKYAKVDVKVFKLLKKEDGSYLLDSTPVRTITSGLQHPGGSEQTEWDGRDDSNRVVPDGFYGIAVFATDSCGNTNMRWTPVEVDNTPPATLITYPGHGDPIGNVMEVKGTADDLHFESFSLEVGEGDSPGSWSLISSGTNPIRNNILGRWNTFGLQGRWTLRLIATDLAGNRSVTTTGIDLGVRKNLIKSLKATPSLFSPNHDGRLDTARIDYELTDLCEVKIEIFNRDNVLKKVYTTTHSGTGLYIWDGRDQAGVIIPDGVYRIKLSVTLVSNPLLTHEEIVSVGVDSTPPLIDIRRPSNLSFHRDEVLVNGTVKDENLLEYSLIVAGVSGTSLLARGNLNRESSTFGILCDLLEGDYTLIVNAKDLAENITEKRISFAIDRTPPKVNLEHPKEGEYYGSGKNIIGITGTIVERSLESYSLRVGSGENPAQWTELLTGHTIPTNPQIFSWKVGKEDGVADGLYTVSLFAKDKAGQSGEARARVIVDHTPPETLITLPIEGAFLRAPAEIRGTAFDQSLEKYSLEISAGRCGSSSNWNVIKTGITTVRDGLIGFLTHLPPDGDYCLRLAAGDRVGNRSETKVNIRIDTRSPSPPGLSGSIEEKSNAKLTWTRNSEPDLAGYNLYRDGQRINSVLIKDNHYLDSNLKDGRYAYWVKALDLAGNESEASNQVKLTVDLKAPEARITSPRDGAIISGFVNIKGTAHSSDDFKLYRVSAGPGSNPVTWTLLRTSPLPTSSDTLARWDTIGLADGLYSIRLEAEDLSSNITTHQISVTIDNTPPSAPVLLSAVPDGPDVTLTWRASTESDLAGYLLFRNHQLVNASGIVLGDFKPYLITGTTYRDKGVPDGISRYYLLAMDQAGNMSDSSNSLELEIDTHSPRALIVEPVDKAKFQDKTPIRAECSDTDISSIQFQYRRAVDSNWVNLGTPVTSTPYVQMIDPISLGWSYGDYHLRAIATDRGGRVDPSPPHITVIYIDLTPPSPPKDLRALTNGREVTLTWTANREEDLSGYQIYRKTGSSRVKVNTTLQKETTYQDRILPDGIHTYEVTAVDHYDNESLPSNQVSVKIYGLYLIQPYTPTGQSAIEIIGWNAAPSSTVEIFNETSSGISSIKVNSNSQGNFSFPAFNLVLGENRISAKATDSAGNMSRSSEPVVVVYNKPPEPPTGLTFSVEGNDIHLSWNPNTESDIAGYNIYRDGKKLNGQLLQTTGETNASFSDEVNLPLMAFDSDPSTFWMGLLGDGYGGSSYVWWEVEFPSPELINRLEIEWGYGFDEHGNWNLYAGSSFEIQVWTGYAWITQATVNWNYASSSILEFKPSYRTDKIRIFITDSTDPDYQRKEVRISEIRIFKDHLVIETSYQDRGLKTGFHSYRITAVDYYGFESQPSEEVRAGVGDVTPPSPPGNLTAQASVSDIHLHWEANSEPDLAGYNLYRKSPQGWIKINLGLITGAEFKHQNLPNGTHTYRVTAVDTAGNESLPSNEAEAIVDEEPPPPPENLQIVSLPEGRTLRASWDGAGASSGFNLYRSNTPGGPYQKVNLSPILSPSYLDGGLVNGKTYYYVATAIDSRGNESRYSHEATGIPQDRVSPSRPEIFFPTRPGAAVILTQVHSDILGTAEPGSRVELFKDSIFLGTTLAEERDAIKTFSLGYVDGNISISPDAKKVAYSSYGSLYLKDLTTDTTTLIVPNGYSPLWSPDGSKLAYLF